MISTKIVITNFGEKLRKLSLMFLIIFYKLRKFKRSLNDFATRNNICFSKWGNLQRFLIFWIWYLWSDEKIYVKETPISSDSVRVKNKFQSCAKIFHEWWKFNRSSQVFASSEQTPRLSQASAPLSPDSDWSSASEVSSISGSLSELDILSEHLSNKILTFNYKYEHFPDKIFQQT